MANLSGATGALNIPDMPQPYVPPQPQLWEGPGGNDDCPGGCPPAFQCKRGMCVPEAGGPGQPNAPQGGGGNTPSQDSGPEPQQSSGSCPPGQVWRTDSQGAYGSGRAGCEPEDWRHNQDKDTCLGARPNCGPGYDAWCDFSTASWKCGYIGGGGGGAAGGAKATGAGGSAMGGIGGASSAFDDFLKKYIMGALEQGSRYDPAHMQEIYGEITRQRSNATKRGEEAVRQEAARRGMSRAGATNAALRAVREGAERAAGTSVVGVNTDKINADWTDKMSAIDRGQRYLDSLRDNEYRYMLSADQRKQFDANLALSYAQLAQQRNMLQMQLESQFNLSKMNAGYNFLMR